MSSSKHSTVYAIKSFIFELQYHLAYDAGSRNRLCVPVLETQLIPHSVLCVCVLFPFLIVSFLKNSEERKVVHANYPRPGLAFELS